MFRNLHYRALVFSQYHMCNMYVCNMYVYIYIMYMGMHVSIYAYMVITGVYIYIYIGIYIIGGIPSIRTVRTLACRIIYVIIYVYA